jgi:kinesin family member 5
MAQQEEVFRVVVRFRPLNEREKALADEDDDLLKLYSDTTFSFDDKAYTFDRVFGPTTGQVELYTESIQPLVQRFVSQPHDVTIIAYGQTSSGKTWTIDGDFYTADDSNNSGILPRSVREIFDAAASAPIEFSFYEIYCEKIIDLLAPSGMVQLYDDRKSNKVFMKGLTWQTAGNALDLLDCLKTTRSKRHYAFTEMNSNSSRSHTIFDLRLQLSASANTYKNFRIVDLAGSERASRTKATGTTFEEGKKINQSLMDLRSIIYQLSRNASAKNVNHRASKLTRILYGSFRGQSRVVVLTCCSPSFDSVSETLGSLQFACYAKRITLKLDDIKAAAAAGNNTQERNDPADNDLKEKIAAMAAEATNREKLIQTYEEEMCKLRQVLGRLHEVKVERKETGVQTDAFVPLIPSVDYSVTDKHLLLLEQEREKNTRYKNTIEMQRKMLKQKMLDNEQLDQELQALRMIKNLILQEF